MTGFNKNYSEVINEIFKIAEKYGYQFYFSEVLRKPNEITRNQFFTANNENLNEIFYLQKDELYLRYDLTTSIIKNDFTKTPSRIIQMGPVFRDGPTSSFRKKEFIQLDLDLVSDKISYRDEICFLINLFLNKLYPEGNYLIKYNYRSLIKEACRQLDLDEEEEYFIFTALDKADKKDLVILQKELEEIRKNLGLKYLKIVEKLNEKKIEKRGEWVHEPLLARGFNYYQDFFFEIEIIGQKGSLMAGGEYLLQNGLKGIGFSLGLERLKIDREKRKKIILSNLDLYEINFIYDLEESYFELVKYDRSLTKELKVAFKDPLVDAVWIINREDLELRRIKVKERDRDYSWIYF